MEQVTIPRLKAGDCRAPIEGGDHRDRRLEGRWRFRYFGSRRRCWKRTSGATGSSTRTTTPRCWPRRCASWKASPMRRANASTGSTATRPSATSSTSPRRHLRHEQLQQLSDEVGERPLAARAVRGLPRQGERYPNLTVKKIPKPVLARCEWGHDDYSLQVENLPKARLQPGQQERSQFVQRGGQR